MTNPRNIAIHPTRAALRQIKNGHPWLFADSIHKQSHDGAAGDLAVLFDNKRRFCAIGLYDPASPIRVKILHQGSPTAIDGAFFAARLAAAAARRAPLATSDHTDGYRLVHGENDGLPALIIDRYAETLVIKLYSAAWFPHLEAILAALDAVWPAERWVLRLSRAVQAGETFGFSDGMALRGELPTGPIEFRENGLRFAADVVQGHKTGFFFDQRENRARVRQMAQGRRVLDVFAYSGGFSVYAAAGGAASITSVDVSAPAGVAAAANLARNGLAVPHKRLTEDAFDALERLNAQAEPFDLVIVDPPSFAKRADDVPRALAAYNTLAELALPLVAPMGLFVMASCSSRVTADEFYETIAAAADEVDVLLLTQAQTDHALDHPIGFPEGAYLKCLFASTVL